MEKLDPTIFIANKFRVPLEKFNTDIGEFTPDQLIGLINEYLTLVEKQTGPEGKFWDQKAMIAFGNTAIGLSLDSGKMPVMDADLISNLPPASITLISNHGISPELLRECVNRIKEMSTLRIPNYDQPADSHIEKCVIDIINKVRYKL